MQMTHCPHCDEQLTSEVKRPEGCVCDTNEWDDPYNLPSVCDKFEADSIGMNCIRCEHDYECHTVARSLTDTTRMAAIQEWDTRASDELLTSLRETTCGEISCGQCNDERERAADEIARLRDLCRDLREKLALTFRSGDS